MPKLEPDEPPMETFEVEEPLLGNPEGATTTRSRRRPGRTCGRCPCALTLLLCVLVGVAASTLTYGYTISRERQRQRVWEVDEAEGKVGEKVEDMVEEKVEVVEEALPWEEKMVLGAPTLHFRDNLRNDTKYITAWLDSGWTNDVQSQGNLLYMAKITNRVPILPPFVPSGAHMNSSVSPMPFSTIFDVPRLAKAMGMPILEWHDVKVLPAREGGGPVEPLGCWSVWEMMVPQAGGYRLARSPEELGLDISYTRVPDTVRLREGEPTTTFWLLAPLAFPDGRAMALSSAPHASEILKETHPPDDQMLCFDYLYYVGIDGPYEYYHEYSPAWKDVLTHAHWTPHLERILDASLRRLFALGDDAPIPLFISLHVRHGDFATLCAPDTPVEACFAPLNRWAAGVDAVRAELSETRGIEVDRVVVTSDERDEGWWADVAARGWTRVDHALLGTVAAYGDWYPIFVDAAVQSRGTGFLGTMQSSMSLLALRRVQDWHGGVGKLIPRTADGQ